MLIIYSEIKIMKTALAHTEHNSIRLYVRVS